MRWRDLDLAAGRPLGLPWAGLGGATLVLALVLAAGLAIAGATGPTGLTGPAGSKTGPSRLAAPEQQPGQSGAAVPAEGPAAEIVTGPWGFVRVTEIGHPPLGMSGPAARAIARRNALTRARESLLRTILTLQTRDGHKVGDVLRQRPEHKAGLRSVLEHASTAGVELAGDAVEITLTVRMDGDNGLGRYLDTIQSAPNRSP